MKEDTEDKIIAAAKELFIKKGYAGTSMSDIAALAGINRPALHYYFHTKERMFEAVAGSIMDAIVPKALQVIQGEQPFWEKVSQLLDCYMEIYRKNPDLVFFILTESRRDIGMLKGLLANRQLDAYFRSIARLVSQEMAEGRIRTVPLPMFVMQVLSQLLFPFMAKPVLIQVFCGREADFDALLDEWKTYLLRELKTTLGI